MRPPGICLLHLPLCFQKEITRTFSLWWIRQLKLTTLISHVRIPTVCSDEVHCFHGRCCFRSITLMRLISSRLEILTCQTLYYSLLKDSSKLRHSMRATLHRLNRIMAITIIMMRGTSPSIIIAIFFQVHDLINSLPPFTYKPFSLQEG